MPLAEGDGSSKLGRYYFDSRTRSCVRFQYKGAKGNRNNFETREQCTLACPGQLTTMSGWLIPAELVRLFSVFENPCRRGEPVLASNGSGFGSRNNHYRQCTSLLTSQSSCGAGNYCHVGPNAQTTVCCPSRKCIFEMLVQCDYCNVLTSGRCLWTSLHARRWSIHTQTLLF